MKKLLSVIAAFFFLATANAQSPLELRKVQVNAGVGFSGWGVPLYIGFDYGAVRNVTIGAEFSFRSYREDWKGDRYRHNIMGFSANGNYHFNSLFRIPSTFDLYAGLNLGFYVWSSPAGYPGDHNSGLGIGAQVGGRYFFSPKAAINLEFGGGSAFSSGKVGITLKLR